MTPQKHMKNLENFVNNFVMANENMDNAAKI
jgi:hypothetical protein